MPEDLDPPAGRIRLKITCPLSPVAEMIADAVDVPAVQGVRRIIPGMAPLLCCLKAGRLIVHREGHPPMTYIISRGVAEIRRDICAVMAWSMRPDEVHPDKIRRLLSDAEATLPRILSESARREMQNRMDFYRLLLSE